MEFVCRCEENGKNKIIETLTDIGCDEQFIGQILSKDTAITEQICLLTEKRAQLLKQLHRAEKNIDCMDYLIYELKKEAEKCRKGTKV